MGVARYVLGVSGGGGAKQKKFKKLRGTDDESYGRNKTFRIREEAWEWNPDGQARDWVEVFGMIHTCQDGRLVDQASEDMLRQLNERLSQQPESSQNSTTRDNIFTQVMGEDRRGRVHTFGLGVIPSDFYGP